MERAWTLRESEVVSKSWGRSPQEPAPASVPPSPDTPTTEAWGRDHATGQELELRHEVGLRVQPAPTLIHTTKIRANELSHRFPAPTRERSQVFAKRCGIATRRRRAHLSPSKIWQKRPGAISRSLRLRLRRRRSGRQSRQRTTHTGRICASRLALCGPGKNCNNGAKKGERFR
jgi:hypothetical protein